MKLTISKEDYLKAIVEAEMEEGAAIAATIARWLDVTPPAVALALRRLRRDKLAHVDLSLIKISEPTTRRGKSSARFCLIQKNTSSR